MHNSESRYINYLFYPCLILFAASLPLPIAYSSSFTILLAFVFIAGIRDLKKNVASYLVNKSNLCLLIIFLTLLTSVLYSDDKNAGMKGILGGVSLVLLPLSLTPVMKLSSHKVFKLRVIFVLSCLVTSAFYFIQTCIRIGLFDGSYKLPTGPVGYKSPYLVYHLTYHQLTPSIHAVFFSLYLALAVLIIIFDFKRKTSFSVVIHAIMILYLLIYLFLLLSATINFALYSFIIAAIFFKYSFKKLSHYLIFFGTIIAGTAITSYLLIVKSIGPDIGDIVYRFDSAPINQKIIFSFIAAILLGIVLIIVKPRLNMKYTPIVAGLFILVALAAIIYLQRKETNNQQGVNNISIRASYAKEAFRIIRDHPLFGVGIGDKKYSLISRDMDLGDKRYVEFGIDTKPNDVFNPHNQFLSFWLDAGILPVMCLLVYFILQFQSAFRHRHMLHIGLLYCFCLFCFTDMALMVQRGQIFFLFFICLFEYGRKVSQTTDKHWDESSNTE